jgi:hypothetical protein
VAEPRWTITEALDHLEPPIGRRDLARVLEPHRHLAQMKRAGRPGRPALAYPVRVILEVHRDWVDRQQG